MKTIEELFEDVAARGLWINNFFQIHTHPANPNIPAKLIEWRVEFLWQANVHAADMSFHEFGKGDSPVAALLDCLAKCDKAGKVRLIRTPEEVQKLRAERAAPDPFS